VTLAKRLLAGLLVLVLLLVAGVVAIAGSRLAERLAQETRRELEREARLVANDWTRASVADSLANSAGAALSRRVTLIDSAGHTVTDAAIGDGPIDAMFAVIQRITHVSAQLHKFEVRSVTAGKDAQGEVSVELIHSDRKVRGRGVSTDILEASAKAYLAAINRIRTLQQKTVSQATPM